MTDLIQGNNLHHRLRQDWLSRLDYVQDQARIFQTELLRVLRQHPDQLSLVEHVDEYRNILARKSQHAEDFRSRIASQERHMEVESVQEELPAAEPHENLESEIGHFFQDFEDLKNTLRRFVSRND